MQFIKNYRCSTKATILTAVVALFISACSSSQVVGRYKGCTNERIECSKHIPEIDVSVVFNPKIASPAKPKTGLDLPDRAQASYIDMLSEKSKTTADLRKDFAAKIRGDDPSGLSDETTFEGTFIITVSDVGPFNPADRLERTEVEIKLDKMKIQSWTSVKTLYNTINAGTVQSTFQKGGEFNITSPSLSNLPVVGGKVTIQSNKDHQVQVSLREEDVTPIFDPDKGSIKIFRHGGFGLNLTGNTLLDVILAPTPEYTAYPELFSITTQDKNGWIKPQQLKLTVKSMKVPRGMGDIEGTATLRYTLRHVIQGDRSYEDADDIVQMITKTVEKKIVLIPSEYSETVSYGLKVDSDQMLVIRRPHRTDSILCFADYEGAEDFLDYLKRPNVVLPETVGTGTIGFLIPSSGGEKFSPLDIPTAKRLTIEPKCQPA